MDLKWCDYHIYFSHLRLSYEYGQMQATPFVSAGKKTNHPSERNRHIPANRQMTLYTSVGRRQTYQSLEDYFFLIDDVLNKSKSKLSEERVIVTIFKRSCFQSIVDLNNNYFNYTVLRNWFHCLFRFFMLLVHVGEETIVGFRIRTLNLQNQSNFFSSMRIHMVFRRSIPRLCQSFREWIFGLLQSLHKRIL